MSDSSLLPPESLWIKMGSDVTHFRISLRVCEWCLVAGGGRERRGGGWGGGGGGGGAQSLESMSIVHKPQLFERKAANRRGLEPRSVCLPAWRPSA